MRLIDADAFKKWLEKVTSGQLMENKHVFQAIDEQPTAICKNCKFYVENINANDIAGDECMGEWGDNPICCEFIFKKG